MYIDVYFGCICCYVSDVYLACILRFNVMYCEYIIVNIPRVSRVRTFALMILAEEVHQRHKSVAQAADLGRPTCSQHMGAQCEQDPDAMVQLVFAVYVQRELMGEFG